MALVFKARYREHEVVATVKRPVTTQFSVAVDGNVVAQSSRPVSSDFICGIKTWFGMKPVWEISGIVEIDGKERRVMARHYTTFTRQYVQILVDGLMIGPEADDKRHQTLEPSAPAD